MKLQGSQIIERLKKPLNSGEVKEGKDYESRLRLFTEPKFKEDVKKEKAWDEFLVFLGNAISKEKAIKIADYIQFPLSVCGISKGLMSDLYKVFNAGNSFFNVTSVKKKGGEKLEALLAKVNLDKWIEANGKEVLKNKPNTIVVVDRDKEGEPYLLTVENERLLDFKFKEGSFVEFEYIVFVHSIEGEEERLAYYDNEGYYVYRKLEGGELELDSNVLHGLGYCPARMFLEDRLNSNGELNRKAPLSFVLAKLQEWQLFDLYKFYTDHYAPFPVVEMVKAKCGVENCNNGVISKENHYFENGDRKVLLTHENCKVCKDNNTIGVGTRILLDPPLDKDEPTASGKFRMISNSTENLEYLAGKLEGIEEYIKLKVIGVDNSMVKQAVNEKQVRGSFENKTNILLDLKTNLDNLYHWIAKTLAKLAIGEAPVEIMANFGTQWYLVGEDELQSKYKTAKESGLPRGEVDMIYSQLIETKYKGHPNKIKRLKLLNKLDPSPYSSFSEKVAATQAGILTKEEVLLSEKILYFVNKFELENGGLVEFGEDLDINEQTKTIYKILKKYVNEYIKSSSKPSGTS